MERKMKGVKSITDKPFRYGGFEKNYSRDYEEWAEIVPAMKRCYCCGGTLRNARGYSGTLLKVNYPYAATFKVLRGKHKGLFHFEPLCRACAYDYGRGVIEMDGNTYKGPADFCEKKYKQTLYESDT